MNNKLLTKIYFGILILSVLSSSLAMAIDSNYCMYYDDEGHCKVTTSNAFQDYQKLSAKIKNLQDKHPNIFFPEIFNEVGNEIEKSTRVVNTNVTVKNLCSRLLFFAMCEPVDTYGECPSSITVECTNGLEVTLEGCKGNDRNCTCETDLPGNCL